MTYLINYDLHTSEYMIDRNKKPEQLNHLVEADSSEQAEAKLIAYWANKDIEYCVSYGVEVHYIHEIIK